MHVALYAPAWPFGSAPNGIVTYVDSLRSALIAQGHRVSVVTSRMQAGCADGDVHATSAGPIDRLAEGIAVRVLKRLPSVERYGRAIAGGFRRVHDRAPIDVIEMEESFGFAAQVAATTPVPVVVKLHGPAFSTLSPHERASPLGVERVRREKEALAKLPFITAPSRCTLAETLEAYDLHPSIAEHVVNPLSMSADAPRWNLDHCEPDTILFVGRFDAVKGGDLVIDAFSRLLARRPTLRLMFAGPDVGLVREGRRVHAGEFIAATGGAALAGRISLLGVRSPSEIGVLRAQAALTVVASRRESQGYTALEAMLQGCPVVCTDTSGLGEIVEHGVTGLKARADDPQDLAEQMTRILDDAALGAALGAAGRRYVVDRHSPTRVVQQTLDVYRRAVELHRHRPR